MSAPLAPVCRLAIALLALAGALPALETPLVINQPAGPLKVVINPGLGTATLYSQEDKELVRYGSVNFLSELSFLENRIISERDGKPINTLQIGTAVNKPTVEEVLAELGKLPQTKKELEADIPKLGDRARAAELAFWSEDHPYDGVVRGALSNRGLLLAIPAKRALMLYEVTNNNLVLSSWRNYGPELYVPQTMFVSTPTPAQILESMPPDLREERREALAAEMEAVGAATDKALQVKPSEVWTAAGLADRFLVFDHANNHLMSYEFSGKNFKLNSVRNIEIDLKIPSVFNSGPDIQAIFAALGRDPVRKKYLEEQGYLPADMAMLTALAASNQVTAAGKVSPLQAGIAGDVVTIDFTDRRMLLVYTLLGDGNGLELLSARDYTVDVAISIIDTEIREQENARVLYAEVKKQANGNRFNLAMLMLKTTLRMSPGMHVLAEKDLKKDLGKHEDWQPTIEKAVKDEAERKLKADARKKAAQEAREAKKPKKP